MCAPTGAVRKRKTIPSSSFTLTTPCSAMKQVIQPRRLHMIPKVELLVTACMRVYMSGNRSRPTVPKKVNTTPTTIRPLTIRSINDNTLYQKLGEGNRRNKRQYGNDQNGV